MDKHKKMTDKQTLAIMEAFENGMIKHGNGFAIRVARAALRLLCEEAYSIEVNELLRPGVEKASFFEEFWREYPKRIDKIKTEDEWANLSPNHSLFLKIMASLKTFKESEGWKKENGKYIPAPVNWLRAKRWEDELDDSIASDGIDGWLKSKTKG